MIDLINLTGIVGGMAFSISAIPQVIKVWKSNDTVSLSTMYLMLWAFASIVTWAYVLMDNMRNNIIQYPLHINYGFSIMCVSYLLYKKLTENGK